MEQVNRSNGSRIDILNCGILYPETAPGLVVQLTGSALVRSGYVTVLSDMFYHAERSRSLVTTAGTWTLDPVASQRIQ